MKHLRHTIIALAVPVVIVLAVIAHRARELAAELEEERRIR